MWNQGQLSPGNMAEILISSSSSAYKPKSLRQSRRSSEQ